MSGISQAAVKLWREMKNFSPPTRITELLFDRESPFPGQKVTFAPFTIITGLHGSGKSTLLRCIAESLQMNTWQESQPPFLGNQGLGGHVTVSASKARETFNYLVDLGEVRRGLRHREPSPADIYPDIHNPFEVPSEISMFFQEGRRTHILDFQDGEIWKQTRRDLDALRDILGITYSDVLYHPIRAEEGAPIFPYVKARRDDQWIDSYSMSYGELAVHRMRWYARFPYDDSVLLLDEPEANIAPRGHAALVDELARLARASQVQIIAVTHSPDFLTRVPLEFIRLCVRSQSGPLILSPARLSDLHDILGATTPLIAFLFVEDEVAAEVLKLILSTHNFTLGRESEIICAGSWNDVLIAARTITRSQTVHGIAVIDGDQRYSLQGTSSTAPLFLPGTEAPEQEILQLAISNPEKLANFLNCSVDSVKAYISELFGSDHHLWLKILATRTGNDWKYCLRAAFSIWHEEAKNRTQAEDLTREIERLLT